MYLLSHPCGSPLPDHLREKEADKTGSFSRRRIGGGGGGIPPGHEHASGRHTLGTGVCSVWEPAGESPGSGRRVLSTPRVKSILSVLLFMSLLEALLLMEDYHLPVTGPAFPLARNRPVCYCMDR